MIERGDNDDKGEAVEAVEVAGATAVSYAEEDLDGDGVSDVVQVTAVTAIDVDGDGAPDVVVMTSSTAVDLDGDGVADVVEVVEAIGADIDGDGVIGDDEIVVSETAYVRDAGDAD